MSARPGPALTVVKSDLRPVDVDRATQNLDDLHARLRSYSQHFRKTTTLAQGLALLSVVERLAREVRHLVKDHPR